MATRNSSGHSLNERVQTHLDGSREYWRDVPGYEGLYRISNRGRVKSPPRTFMKRSRWGKSMRTCIKGRFMKFHTDKKGRTSVGLTNLEGKQWPYAVARLVLAAFVGPCPEGMEACHFPDRDPANNNLSNLRWDTHVNNQADRIIHGTQCLGEKNGDSRLTNREVLLIRKLRTKGWELKALARRFRVSDVTIGKIVHRKAWKHI